MAARLKVFVTSDGLTDYVVAASSRPKALAAWGSHQDLFKTGLAHETEDAELVKAATAQPGEVLRRPAATRGDLAKLKPPPPGGRKPSPQPSSKPAPEPKPAGPSPAALRKVADLEQRLAELDRSHQAAREEMARRRARLERDASTLEADHAAKRETLVAALSAARQAL
jgi:hypothetical protein